MLENLIASDECVRSAWWLGEPLDSQGVFACLWLLDGNQGTVHSALTVLDVTPAPSTAEVDD